MTELLQNSLVATWFKAFEAALAGLPSEDRKEITDEVRSHFEERVREGQAFSSILGSFGDPCDYAETFLDVYSLTQARKTGKTITMFVALMRLGRRSLIAAAGTLLSLVFMLLIASSLVCMATKAVKPDLVGLWVDRPLTAQHRYVHSGPEHLPLRLGSDHIQFGYASPRPAAPEVLGLWMYPVLLLLALLGYLGLRLTLSRTLKALLRRRQ